MKRTLASLAALVAVAASVPGHAATIAITIAGYQYTPSGWATADPFNLSSGAATTATPGGTPHDAPTVRRGDIVAFTSMDAVPHTVTKVSGAGSWTPLNVAGLGSASLPIPPTFPTGAYVYRCTIHQGMRGAFTVAA